MLWLSLIDDEMKHVLVKGLKKFLNNNCNSYVLTLTAINVII